jgi:hypothetical protein
MRQLMERIHLMLQWNSKIAFVVLVSVALAAMLAFSAGISLFGGSGLNFTW